MRKIFEQDLDFRDIITVLNKYKIKIHRTDLEGTIKYCSYFN